eukprot:6200357-Pleurochrysis_carterae.AAC.10
MSSLYGTTAAAGEPGVSAAVSTPLAKEFQARLASHFATGSATDLARRFAKDWSVDARVDRGAAEIERACAKMRELLCIGAQSSQWRWC